MKRTSGPRQERIVRNGIFMLMCVGMGGYFLYDGWIGYPGKNFEENRLQLPVESRSKADGAKVYPGANMANVPEIKRRFDDATAGQRREVLESAIGGPPSVELSDALYYFGQDGLLKVGKSGDRVLPEVDAIPAKKTLKDFQYQKYLGVFVGAIGLYMLYFLFRVIRTRAEVSDDGLSLNGRKPIPFNAMKSLDTSEFRKKGKVYLVCEGGPAPRVLLDEYHFADFDQIMAGICEKTGFQDPVAAEKAEKAAKARGAAGTDTDSTK
ncbi:MAG: hypothetical protein H6818_21920 [Phycisphaerales bacterium]|nr:hypothetical protein [Phycisphaerales bacterium]MCB9862449.1 hypothetical protein [Phycisphaerales bacterium]